MTLNPINSESSADEPQLAVVVLCGGRSVRMGQDKANIAFGNETLLQRVCRLTAAVGNPVIVVAAANQDLPGLSDSVTVLRDELPDQGPLAGFVTALRFLATLDAPSRTAACSTVFLTSCDTPFLNVDVLRMLAHRLRSESPDFDGIVISHNQNSQPLQAVYRTRILATADGLLGAGKRSMHSLLCALNILTANATDYCELDPELRFLQNTNTPEELSAARAMLSVQDPARM